MLTPLAGALYAQPMTAFGAEGRERRSIRGTAQGDVVAFSDEAYAALDAFRKRMTQGNGNSSVAAENKASGGVDKDEKSLLGQLQAYLKNPALARAMERMEQTIGAMGFDEATTSTILDEVQAAFRSGVPAKGQQTTDAMRNLQKNLRDSTGLTDDQLAKLMEKITTVITDIQEQDPQNAQGAVA